MFLHFDKGKIHSHPEKFEKNVCKNETFGFKDNVKYFKQPSND